MAAFTKFIDNAIFADRTVNQTCDYLYRKLIEALEPAADPPELVPLHFLLSGTAAAILQDEGYDYVKNIIFQTDNREIFDWLVANVDKLFPSARNIKFKNRILLYIENLFFELWFTAAAVDPKTFSGIQIQYLPEIPEAMLI